jgi:hypothetical protein
MVRIPQGSTITTGTPGGTVTPGPTGFQFYQLDVPNVKAGDVVTLSLSYVPPAATNVPPAAAPLQSGSGGDMLIPALFVIIALGVGALLFVSVRLKMTPDGTADLEPATVAQDRTPISDLPTEDAPISAEEDAE